MANAVIILGSNSPDKKERIEKASRRLSETAGKIVTTSSLYETEPWGFEADEHFINQVSIIETPLPPDLLLNVCLSIENELGRVRHPNARYASRSIDIDLLFYDSKIIRSDRLTLPHPRIQERNFVLVPLNEILPDFIHPTLGQTMKTLLKQSKDRLKVKKLPMSFNCS